MLAAIVICAMLGQTALDSKPFTETERVAGLKALLSPIHLSDPMAPVVKDALESPVSLSFERTPLPDVVKKLAPLLGGNIRIHPGEQPIDDEGRRIPLPNVTYRCAKTPLKVALEEMLSSIDFDYGFDHEGVEIASRDYLLRSDDWRIYPIPDLVEMIGAESDLYLIRAIQDDIDYDGWLCNGGDGEIQPLPGGALLVKCNPTTHRSIARFLAAVRWLLGRRLSTWSIGVLDLGSPPPRPHHRPIFLQPGEFFLPRIQNELRQRHDFDIRNATPQQAISVVEKTIGVPMKVDFRDLAERARAEDDDFLNRRITIIRRGIQAKTALNLLRELDVHCVESAEGLTVKYGAGEEFAEFPHTWRYYPTDDIVDRSFRFRSFGRLKQSDVNQYLMYVLQSFSNDAILCFNEWPDFFVIDGFGFTGHLYRGPRLEHRRFEQLYAGMCEAARRRPEILRLMSPPVARPKD